MKVLLRHIRSGLYYAGEDQWVSKGALARDFVEVGEAAQWLETTRLSGVEISLDHNDPGLRSRFDAHARGARIED